MSNRDGIIKEAAMLFRTYGIRSVTMDMIANQMGISKRTIYELFSDKDELLEGVLKWMTEKQREIVTRITNESGNVIEAIFNVLDFMRAHLEKMSPAFLLDIRKYRHRMLNNFDGKNEMEFFGFHEDIIRQGINEGIFRDDIDIKISNKCLFEVSKMSDIADLSIDDEFLRKDVMMNVFINYLRGISTPKGLELINRLEENF
jgi:TetR/AcrR family transcriptional regulator, cholesterol catabolism regulator